MAYPELLKWNKSNDVAINLDEKEGAVASDGGGSGDMPNPVTAMEGIHSGQHLWAELGYKARGGTPGSDEDETMIVNK